MSKGAVPIPYIIALVLAIAVIAIVAYWLFFSGGQFDVMIREKGCDAKLMAYCGEYRVSGGSMEDFSGPCGAGSTEYYAPECCEFEKKFHGGGETLC